METYDRYNYITKAQYEDILKTLNVDFSDEDGGVDSKKYVEILECAMGDLEADLVKRFVVPLIDKGGTSFKHAPLFAQRKVLNAMKNKIKQIIAKDKQKNIVIDTTERYIDLNKKDYDDDIKSLIDHERDFGFRLQGYSQEGAMQPVQSMGVGRPDNERGLSYNSEDILY